MIFMNKAFVVRLGKCYKSSLVQFSVLSCVVIYLFFWFFSYSVDLTAQPCLLECKIVHTPRYMKVKPSNMKISFPRHPSRLVRLTAKNGITRDLT